MIVRPLVSSVVSSPISGVIASQGGRPAWVPEGVTGRTEFAPSYRTYINRRTFTSYNSAQASGLVGFSRTASGTYLDASGVYQSFAGGVPRIGDRGILVEPSRTNLIPYSNNVTSNGWPGASGAENITIGAGQTIAPSVYPTAAAGVFYTYSLEIKSAANVGAGIELSMNWNGVPGASTPTAHSLTSSYVRISNTGTSVAGLNGVQYRIANTTGSPITIQVRRVQLEVGSLSTPIDTNGTAITRDADVSTEYHTPGVYDITITFDNDSTQLLENVTVTSSGYTIPTNLNKRYVIAHDLRRVS